MDQARTLRRLAHAARQEFRTPHTNGKERSLSIAPHVKVLSFTSGKGGVGKTHIVVNLAYALQRLGQRVLILDADLGLANVDVLLGLAPRFTIQHVLAGEKRLEEIVVQGPAGMKILPASSGVQELADLTETQRQQVFTDLGALEQDIDFLLIDTGAGISTNVTSFNVAAQDIVVVVTPEPTSITDAYALMKVLATQHAETNFHVLVNVAKHAAEAQDAFQRLRVVAEHFLNIHLHYLGFILHDSSISQAVRHQKALMEMFPGSIAAQCFQRLAQQLLTTPVLTPIKGNVRFFWQRLFERSGQAASLNQEDSAAEHFYIGSSTSMP